jgi:hypothetical protein
MGHVLHMTLGGLAAGDVERARDDPDRLVAGVSQRRFGGEEYPVLARAVDELVLETLDRSTVLQDELIECLAARTVLRAENLLRFAADGARRIDSHQCRLIRIHEQEPALLVGRADHRRHGVDHLRQALA